MIDRFHLKSLMHYGGWIWVVTLLASLLDNIDHLIIAAFSGAKELAYYTVPFRLVSRIMVISLSVSAAVFPRLASASSDQAREMALRTTSVLVAIMTPIIIVGLFVVHPFLNLWVGEAFARSSAGVAELILLGVWVNALLTPHRSRLLAANNPNVLVVIYLIEIPIYFLMLWYGITYWGIVGAAAAWSLRLLIDTIIQLFVCDALTHTLHVMVPSLLMVVTAAVVALETDVQSYVRWSIGLTLLVLTLLRDKELLIDALNTMRQRAKYAT